LTIKRGESREIKVKITEPSSASSSSSATKSSLHMMASGTLTPTGDLGNSTGSFSQESFSTTAGGKSKHVTFTFKPSMNLKPGKYMLMIGAEDEAVTNLRAIEVNVS
jgi:uncharacterized membrane protein